MVVGMAISRYQYLSGRRPIHQKEYYEGYYENQPILFDRMFRGYRFTNEECQALCQGEWLEVHNLQNGMVLYGVRGSLYKDIFASANSSLPIYIFKVKTSLVNNPTYQFSKRKPYFGPNKSEISYDYKQQIEQPSEPEKPRQTQFILHEASVDMFSDEEDSKLAAMISAAAELPKVVDVKVNENNVKIFVPVIAGQRYTEHGMEPVSESELQAISDVSEDKNVDNFVDNVDNYGKDTHYDEIVMDAEHELFMDLMSDDALEDDMSENPYLVDGSDEEPFE